MILVLGGAGYIGSHAVKKLIELGEEVVVADNLETGHREAVHEKATFCRVDVRNERMLEELFNAFKIEAVMHFSAHSLVGESMKEPIQYFENNVSGTITLMKVMKRHHVQRIVFSSSAAVYGESSVMPIAEDCETRPENPYGESKLMMEKMFAWADAAHGLKYVSLRYFNVAGADLSGNIGEAHKVETHLIPLILQVPLGKKERISVYGTDYPTKDGTCVRDYVHVMDVVDAHILALNHLRNGGSSDVINLGSGEGFSVMQIIDVARRITGHAIPVLVEERRLGDPSVLVASCDKAKRILNWTPKHTDVETIISDAWRWHQRHPEGYEE